MAVDFERIEIVSAKRRTPFAASTRRTAVFEPVVEALTSRVISLATTRHARARLNTSLAVRFMAFSLRRATREKLLLATFVTLLPLGVQRRLFF